MILNTPVSQASTIEEDEAAQAAAEVQAEAEAREHAAQRGLVADADDEAEGFSRRNARNAVRGWQALDAPQG